MDKNYYKILEVDKNASSEVIDKAYKALAKKYHPDLQDDSNKAQAEEKLKLINEAYSVLSDPSSRAKYDSTLKESEISQEEFSRLSRENQALYNELNNLKNGSYKRTNSHFNSSDNNNYSNTINENANTNNNVNTSTNNKPSQEEILKTINDKYKREIEYEKQIQEARQNAYRDAYIQDLKNRGYKIRYKKSLNDYLKSFLALVITIAIIVLLVQIPFIKNFFINIYEDNPIIKAVVDIFINLFSPK